MKPRLPRRRKLPPRDIAPPDVPEVSAPARPAPENVAEDIPDHIRRMLEAAYT